MDGGRDRQGELRGWGREGWMGRCREGRMNGWMNFQDIAQTHLEDLSQDTKPAFLCHTWLFWNEAG